MGRDRSARYLSTQLLNKLNNPKEVEINSTLFLVLRELLLERRGSQLGNNSSHMRQNLFNGEMDRTELTLSVRFRLLTVRGK